METNSSKLEPAVRKLLIELESWGILLKVNDQTCEIRGIRFRPNSDITRLLKEIQPGKMLTKVLIVEEGNE